ncbi:MAG: alpha amylase N-terminal ig-like domain-containing protein [Candidatus Izemoplasmataceae bacterium]
MKHSHYFHIPKSSMAFARDLQTIELRFRSISNTARTVEVIHADPFDWTIDEDRKHWNGALKKPTPMTLEASTDEYDHWHVVIDVPTKRVKYAFLINKTHLFVENHLVDLETSPDFRHNLNAYYNFPYILQADLYEAPGWVKDTVWYSIFPDRFHNQGNDHKGILAWESNTPYRNDQFYGGNLKGIEAKLPYLKDLGFTGIYLTPLFKAPSAHKYDTVDYYRIDPQFGSKDDLKAMVETAHSLGIRVILDAVFNHVSNQHPFFRDVLEKGPKSPYYDYFFIHEWPIDKDKLKKRPSEGGYPQPPYETFAFTPRMPKLNADHPDLKAYLLKVARYWIETFDIDGWRLDVSNEVSHDFWRDFRKTVKAVKPDAFILGENLDQSNPWLEGDQHDAVMNYEFLYPLWAFFGKDEPFTMDARDFANAIKNTLFSYPRPVIQNMFNIVDSHDTKRIARVVGEDTKTLRQVYLMQYLLPGAPSIFYGGEIGLTGAHDPDNRRCMVWEEDRQDGQMKAFIKKLNTLYHTHPSFKSSTLTFLYSDQDVLVVQKGDLFALFNRSETSRTLSLKALKGRFKDLFTGADLVLNKALDVAPMALSLWQKRTDDR